MKPFSISGFSIYSERDSYESGCKPDSGRSYWDETEIEADNLKELIIKICNHLEVDYQELSFNACDEIGRLDAQRHEDDEGSPFDPHDYEDWKKGELEGWLTTYTGFVVGPVNLEELK